MHSFTHHLFKHIGDSTAICRDSEWWAGIELKNDVIKCYQYKYCNTTKLLNRITEERSRETNSRDGEE